MFDRSWRDKKKAIEADERRGVASHHVTINPYHTQEPVFKLTQRAARRQRGIEESSRVEILRRSATKGQQ